MTLVVAMSGGVDSSTAAALLAENNSNDAPEREIIGLTMQLWNQRRLAGLGSPAAGVVAGQTSGRCCSLDDAYDARRVANFLGIPFYVVNFESRFEQDVVRPFVERYLAGETPIPCSACNTEVKFDQLIQTAQQVGSERVATGHYARVQREERSGRWRLFRGVDQARDQSYFLFGLTQEQLSRSVFPLGELTKQEVRAIARARGLPVADKPDSQEICFVPSGSYRDFIQVYLAEQGRKLEATEGEIVSTDGHVLGEHSGIHNFTVGQRKGLGMAVGTPLYVIELDPSRQRVIVGRNEELFRRRLIVRDVNWILPLPEGAWVEAEVKIRNKHASARARLEALRDNQAQVEFVEPQRAVTPGQAAVFYRGDEVLGGGWIAHAEN
jgi:tRNA-specific 2-thiouridylase